MPNMKITLARIDNRLMHGIVMTQYLPSTNSQRIMVIDDATANDDFLSEVAVMAVPKEFKGLVMTVDQASQYLQEDNDQEVILVLVKFVKTIVKLVDAGVQIKNLNVGGVGMRPKRKTIYRNIALNPEEIDMIKSLLAKDIKVTVQIVPSDSPINIEKLI